MKEKKLKKIWAYADKQVEAHSRSEARAEIKKLLKLSSNGRLPKGAFVALVKDPNKV